MPSDCCFRPQINLILQWVWPKFRFYHVAETSEPEVKILSLSIQSPGRPDIVLPLPVEPNLKGAWFTLKEGSHYKLKFAFYVRNNIVSGLRYANTVWKTGLKGEIFTFTYIKWDLFLIAENLSEYSTIHTLGSEIFWVYISTISLPATSSVLELLGSRKKNDQKCQIYAFVVGNIIFWDFATSPGWKMRRVRD